MAESTPYLNLPIPDPGNTNWYAAFKSMVVRVDKIGKYIKQQSVTGDSLSIRASLYNGTLVEAIRIVPDTASDTIAIYLGRAGKGDRIVIQSSSLYASLNLSNQNATATQYVCSIGATWSDEDGGVGDPIQNTSIVINPRNNMNTIIELPPARNVAHPNNYLGSLLQIGNDPSGVGTDTPHIKMTCQSTTGTHTYLIPAYKL